MLALFSITLIAVSIGGVSHSYEYGVDTSWPVHYSFLGTNPSLSETIKLFRGHKIDLYYNYIEGCKEMYANQAHQCTHNEEERLMLNRNQPKKMTNYTDIGFKKVRLSDELFTAIREFWQETMDNGGIEKLKEEYWPPANTYTNHWVSPTKMKDCSALHAPIWKEVEAQVKEWIPKAKTFSRSSLYGIRVYQQDSILSTHVDRDPLITSAIINVDQDVGNMYEPWPLEVYG